MHPPTISRSVALATALALVASCGGGTEGPRGQARSFVLTLSPVEELQLGDDKPQLVQRLEVPADLDPWRVTSGEGALREAGDTFPDLERVLTLSGHESPRLVIPGPFEAGSFNSLVVEVARASGVGVDVQLHSEGRMVQRAGASGAAEAGVQRVWVQLPRARADQAPYGELELGFVRTERVQLLAVELWSRPLARLLPPPGHEGEHRRVNVGDTRRPAVGLSSDVPLKVDVPPRGPATLAGAVGIPTKLAVPNERLRLIVEAGDQREIVPIRIRNPIDSRWVPFRFELEAAETAVEVRFTLEAPDGGQALCALAHPQVRLGRDPEAPTIVLVTSDTHRGDHLGLVAGSDLQTPVLDALAQRGVLYTDARSQTNITIPSHAALFTGTHPRDTGVLDNFSGLNEHADTLAEAFRAAGWCTWGVAANSAVAHAEAGLSQGFDRLEIPALSVSRAGENVERILAGLDEVEGQPLFLWLHLFDAHAPYEPPGEYDRRYYPDDRDPYDPSLPDPGLAPEALPAEAARPGLRDLEFPQAQYRAEVSYLDAELGTLLDHERMERAVICVTSDHGECFGEGGVWFNHSELYPANLHIPLVLAGPGVPSGQRVDSTVLQQDVGRTLLDLADLKAAPFPGENLLTQEPAPTRRPAFALSARADSAAVTVERWHLILTLQNHRVNGVGVRKKHFVELYDLEADPRCTTNLVDREFERAETLRSLVITWLGEAQPKNWGSRAELDAGERADLAAMGYVDGASASGSDYIDADCACERCARFQ